MGNSSPYKERYQGQGRESRANSYNQQRSTYQQSYPNQNPNYYPNPNNGYGDRYNQPNPYPRAPPNYPPQGYQQNPYPKDITPVNPAVRDGVLPPDLKVVNLDNQFGSAPPLVIDVKKQTKDQTAPRQGGYANDKKKKQLFEQEKAYDTFGKLPPKDITANIGGNNPNYYNRAPTQNFNNNFPPNQYNKNPPPLYNGDNKYPPPNPNYNMGPQNNYSYNRDNRFPPNQMIKNALPPITPNFGDNRNFKPGYPPPNPNLAQNRDYPRNEKNSSFNQNYERNQNAQFQPPKDPLQRPPPDQQNPQYNQQFMQNPNYYREDYRNKDRAAFPPNETPQNVPPIEKQRPPNDTSIEKGLPNNGSFLSKDESNPKAVDPKQTTLDIILLKKENDTKIKERDLMIKHADGVNKDYNNVFLTTQQANQKKNEQNENPILKRRTTHMTFKGEGFEKLEEISNFFMKKKFLSISKDEKIIEDYSHFFIFPGTAEYNQLNINPLFFVLYNDDSKSKYCCFPSCRTVYARILHAKGVFKGYDFLEIVEDEAIEQVLINYTEEGHKFRIGTIEYQKNCCADVLEILNEKNQLIFTITQPTSNGCKILCKCNCEDCQSLDFEVLSSSGKFVSKIHKNRNTCCFLSNSNEYDELTMDFPEGSSKTEKSLLLAASIFIQKKYFEG